MATLAPLPTCHGFFIALALAGCSLPAAPECSNSFQCDLVVGGGCYTASSGRSWCRYPEGTCASGYRWSPEAGDSLANQCVAAPDAGPDAPVDSGTSEDAAVSDIDAPPPDAHVEAPADASLPDAPDPTPDANVDAAAPDAATSGTVTVTALDRDWTPFQGADVLAHDLEGTLAGMTTTTGTGIVSLDVPIGGMVTVASRKIDDLYLTTVTGVHPLDVLTTISLDATKHEGPELGGVSISFPGAYSGAAEYNVGTSCETSTGSVTNPTVQVHGKTYRDCTVGNTIHAIAAAQVFTANRVKPLAFSLGSAQQASGSALLGLGAWNAAMDLDVTIASLPAAAANTSFSAEVVYHTASVGSDDEPVAANKHRISVPASPVAGMALRLQLELDYGQEGENFAAAIMRSTLPLPATAPTYDASLAPPRLHDLAIAEFATGRPRISWSVDGSDTGFIGGYVLLVWPSPGPGKPAVTWLILFPLGASARAPALPPALAALVPKTAPGAAVVLIDAGMRLTSYDDFKGWFIPYLDPKSRQYERMTTIGSVFR